ncbi:MAG: hypothetical protein GX593_04975 [Actinomycetales bacterium]|nr:hypothetical protein [Actinomycetales bacterium]
MHAKLTTALAGVAILSLVTAPVAAAAPSDAAAGSAPAAAGGYQFEREWTYTSYVPDALTGAAASPRDEVFVTGEDEKVRRYDLQGKLTKTWSLPEYSGPQALAVDPRNGDLHVAIWGSIGYGVPNGVLVYSRDGSLLRVYDVPDDDTWATSIAIDTDGSVYLTNAHDDRVHRFSSTGAHLGSFGGEGTANGKFDQPGEVAIGKDGTLFVTDVGNERVQQFTKTGTFRTAWGQGGLNDGQFSRPNEIVVGPSGNLFIADNMTSRVQEFTPAGRYVRTVGEGYLRRNFALTFDRHGALYVGGYLDSLVQGVAKFAPVAASTKVTAKASKQTYGKRSKVTITVSRKATGRVTLKAGKKTVKGTLKAGKATLYVPKKALKPGKRTVTVRYAGVAGVFAASSTKVKLTVAKAKPSVKVKRSKKTVKRGAKVSFTVTVKATGTTPRGKVTVKASGAKTRTVKLNKKGKAKVTLQFAKNAKLGKRSVKITYRGTSLVKKATKKTSITVRR